MFLAEIRINQLLFIGMFVFTGCANNAITEQPKMYFSKIELYSSNEGNINLNEIPRKNTGTHCRTNLTGIDPDANIALNKAYKKNGYSGLEDIEVEYSKYLLFPGAFQPFMLNCIKVKAK
jgi:hypothetical protein